MPLRKRSEMDCYATKSQDNKPKRCVAYARMSTERQKDSLEDQQASFERIKKQYHLPWDGATFLDKGVSGWKHRDGLENLIAAVSQQKKADTLIVRSLNRLTRQPVNQAMQLLQRLRDIGIRFVFTEDRGQLELPESGNFIGWFQLILDCGMSHDFSRTNAYHAAQSLVSKLERSVELAKKQPGWSVSGKPRLLKCTGAEPSFGYSDVKVAMAVINGKKTDWHFERHPHPEHAAIVKQMFAMLLAGKTPTGISRWLNEQGILTQRGYQWNHDAVDKILTRRACLGTFVRLARSQGSFQHALRRGPQKVPDEAKTGRPNSVPYSVMNDTEDQFILEDCWEPLVSKRDFDKVQGIISRRRKSLHKERGESGALSCGVSRCGHCGSSLRLHRFKDDGRVTYACTKCDNGGHVPENVLLPQTLQEVHKVLAKEQDRLQQCLAQPEAKNTPVAQLDRKLKSITQELESAQANLTRLMKRNPVPEAAVDVAVGTVETLTAQKKELEKERRKQIALPADEEAQLRETIAWLKKTAVAVREWTVTTPDGEVKTEILPDAPGTPYVGFRVLGSSNPKVAAGTHYKATRLVYDAERLRGVLKELGLVVDVTWAKRRQNLKKEYKRPATVRFQLGNKTYPLAPEACRATHSHPRAP